MKVHTRIEEILSTQNMSIREWRRVLHKRKRIVFVNKERQQEGCFARPVAVFVLWSVNLP